MWFERPFSDRRHAGHVLAGAVATHLAGAARDDVVVLGLPRGGVPVAFEVARKLGAPLDVFIVRKLGVPGHDELAMGAIASGEVLVHNRDVIDALGIDDGDVESVILKERAELARRELSYRESAPPLDVAGKIVVLVDDGIATGSTIRAAIAAIHDRGARRIIVAAPVAPKETCSQLTAIADDVVVVEVPERFRAVGEAYEDFTQTTDAEVHDLLARARLPGSSTSSSDGSDGEHTSQ